MFYLMLGRVMSNNTTIPRQIKAIKPAIKASIINSPSCGFSKHLPSGDSIIFLKRMSDK